MPWLAVNHQTKSASSPIKSHAAEPGMLVWKKCYFVSINFQGARYRSVALNNVLWHVKLNKTTRVFRYNSTKKV